MRCIAVLAGVILLTAASAAAHADYIFRFAQFDEAGEALERGTWRCDDAAVQANRCTQGVMLVIEGRPEPIEMRFKDDGGILRITMAAGAWLVAARSATPLIFRHDRVIAGSIEAHETEERVGPDGGKAYDLVGRHHFLATLTLIVTRCPQPWSGHSGGYPASCNDSIP
jgi:hypothetical protein